MTSMNGHQFSRVDSLALPRLEHLLWPLLLLAALSGCDDSDGTGEWYTNWDIAGGCASDAGGDVRPNGAGGAVDVCDALGEHEWVWVTYAAPWCSASKSQAAQIRALQKSNPADLAMFTVLTAGQEPFSQATAGHARSWAGRYGLPASHVLAEQSSRTIPQHLLIGPDGRTFYRYVGFLDAQAIQRLLSEFRDGVRFPDVRELPRP